MRIKLGHTYTDRFYSYESTVGVVKRDIRMGKKALLSAFHEGEAAAFFQGELNLIALPVMDDMKRQVNTIPPSLGISFERALHEPQ